MISSGACEAICTDIRSHAVYRGRLLAGHYSAEILGDRAARQAERSDADKMVQLSITEHDA